MNTDHPHGPVHKHHIVRLIVLLLVASLGQVTSDLYLPSLPGIAEYFSTTPNTAQFTLVIFMVGFSVSQIIYGPLSDAVGRRLPIIIGLSITLLGGVVCWQSSSIFYLFLGRLLQGLGVGAGTALIRSILRDLFEKEELAHYNSYFAISSVFILSTAPILGGYIQKYAGWQYNFLFLAIYTTILLYFFHTKIPETSQHHASSNFTIKNIAANTKILLTNPTYLRYLFCPVLTYAGILSWLTATPILLHNQVGLSASQIGWAYLFSGTGFLTGALSNMKLVRRVGIEIMINTGIILQLCGGLLMLGFFLMGYINTLVIMLPILFYMAGSSLVFPNSSAGALTPFPKIAGTAGAMFGLTQVVAGAITSAIISSLHDENQLPVAITLICVATLSLISFHLLKILE